MKLVIEGGTPLRGEARVPADKSITHRALIFNAIAEGTATIAALNPGEDNRSTARVLCQLGVKVEDTPAGFEVSGVGTRGLREPSEPLDCGNSGTTIRLMCGVLAGAGLPARLIGDASLSARPMGRVCDPLRQLGAQVGGVRGDRELPPIDVTGGGFKGGAYTSVIASAQVKSALMLAGVTSGAAVTVTEPHTSRDHSERMLRAMGAAVVESEDGGHRVDLAAGATLAAGDLVVPGDFSSAAFLVAAGVLVPDSDVVITDVGVNASRTGFLEILEELGANVRVSAWREMRGEPVGSLTAKPAQLTAIRPGDIPTRVGGAVIPRSIDELVVLAAVASQAEGPTEITDAGELRVKESDRIAQTARLLEAFGVDIEPRPDGMVIKGPQPLRPARLDVSGDHRIALSATVLACAAPGTSELEGFDIAAVSFPGFAETLRALGARVHVEN